MEEVLAYPDRPHAFAKFRQPEGIWESHKGMRDSMKSSGAAVDGYLGRILDRVEDPVFLIDRQRNILFLNVAAEHVLNARSGFCMRHGRLTFANTADNEWFAQVAADRGPAVAFKRSVCRGLKVKRGTASRDWLALVSAVPADTLHGTSFFTVHLVGRLNPRRLPTKALVDLFGLSRKELEVLARLVRSESLRDVAVSLSLSHETIRAYLKRIFRKCGVQSQVELLALLQKISLLA